MKTSFTRSLRLLSVLLLACCQAQVKAQSTTLKVSIGRDTLLPLKQSSKTSLLLRAGVQGTPQTFHWSQLSGAAVLIQSPQSSQTNITDFKVGHYSFKCEVSDGLNVASDTIRVQVVNYQNKNRVPCRVGQPKVWTLFPTSTTDLKYPYLRRSGFDIQGGDTIKINRNPNNGGVYNHFYLGDFGGDEGCPVVVVPNGEVVEIGGAGHRWFVGNNSTIADTGWVNHVVFDGTYLRNKGIQYGFQSTGTGFGMGARLVTDLEIKGTLFKGNTLGIQIKIFSDSTKPWTVYDNFTMKNIRIHDNYFSNIYGSEGLYIGSTDPSGTTQAGSDGPVPRMDSVFIYNNFFNGTAWDPIQTSNARYSEIHDNIILNGSTRNQSSQNWGILLGGNCTGKIYNNVMYNGKGGQVGTLGYGDVEIFYNFIDSTKAGGGTSDGIYANGISSYILEAATPEMFLPLRLNIHDNIISRFERNAIFNANNDKRSLAGKIYNNHVVEPTKSLAQVITSNAKDQITNNTLYRSFPVTISDIGNDKVGPLVQVTQGAAIDTFSKAKDVIDWLFKRLTGKITPPNQAPSVAAGADQNLVLPQNSTTLKATASDPDGTITAYLWTQVQGPAANLLSPTAAQTQVTGLVAGSYRFVVEVTDNQGAKARDTVQLSVSPAPNQAASTASVYPNPARDVVNIHIEANTSKNLTALSIYDANGKALYRESFMRNQSTITKQVNVSQLLPGTYFIEVSADINTRIGLKLVKE